MTKQEILKYYGHTLSKLHSFGVTDDMWEPAPNVSGTIILNWKGKKFWIGLRKGRIRADNSEKWYWLSNTFFK